MFKKRNTANSLQMSIEKKYVLNLLMTVKFILLPLLALLVYSVAVGQTQLERSVISSGGNESSSSSLRLLSTIGELAVQTATTTNYIYTQGFQQPVSGKFGDSIKLFLSSTGASCRGRNNGLAMIDSISGCQPPYQIVWSAGKNPADTTQAINLSPGIYTVEITSSDGCNDLFSFTIGLINPEECALKFYSGITPNDSRNNQWIIDNVELFPNNKVSILNRLGNLVWEGSNYDNNQVVWGGENLNNNDLPSATYFYIFEADGLVEKGWIELTR